MGEEPPKLDYARPRRTGFPFSWRIFWEMLLWALGIVVAGGLLQAFVRRR